MLRADKIEELIEIIQQMGREELIEQFREYPAPFPIDFSDEFLAGQSLDKLRHVFFGLCMHTGKLPEVALAA